LLFVLAGVAAEPALARPREVEVVVTLRTPALAQAAKQDRALAAVTMRASRVDLASPASLSYVQMLRREQDAVALRIEKAITGARIRWRFAITFDGLAVVVPRGSVARLARVAGVERVWPSVRFHSSLDRTPQLIGAPALWGPAFATAGQGMKIGVIDEGVDQTHPFLDPAGYTMPPGFPKGNASFTTAKVIAARAFPPPTPTWKYANLPFDPENSEHGTHVAGIAAGNRGTRAVGFAGQPVISGIAPAAYIGNYKALTIPTPDFGLDGNAPEIAAAIEAAVADGMNVINLSLGEPEVEQSRDIVVRAIDGAADAGVVPVIAAGNDFAEFGTGSVGSPGSAPKAITAAASTTGRGAASDIVAGFSSSGPTPISLQMKPDVTAPGVSVLSSVPAREGSWALFSGTSMATPHIAGAAALLKQQHPAWTVAQVKSALEQTGDPVFTDAARSVEVSAIREGGGRIDLPRANTPLVFAAPSGVSFGFVRPGSDTPRDVVLTDAGGGAGTWQVSIAGNLVTAPTTVTVPGTLTVHASVPSGTAEAEASGFVRLTRGTDVRRIPFFLAVRTPHLAAPVRTLTKPGTYTGNTARGQDRVQRYRYPEPQSIADLAGPEQVFRLRVRAGAANVGVRVISGRATPRLVRSDDENRLVGYTGLPFDLNPYRNAFGSGVPVVAAILPNAGEYDAVFDTRTRSEAGKFTFRWWANDVTPPVVQLRGYARGAVTLAITDPGSGVDTSTLVVSVDGQNRPTPYKNGVARAKVGVLRRGTHRVSLVVSDYQEAKNMEDVARILPNTRTFTKTFRVR
jgi:subtilisin family serine protease